MDSMQTRHRVLGDASWTRGKVSKARMQLVTSRCPRIRAPSSSTPRGKMVAPYSSFSRHRLRTPSSARSDPTQCRRHKTVRSMVGLSWFLTMSSIQVQAWPVHQIRPNRGVGLRRLGPWDSKTSSSREVSRDSQRLRHWTPDEPVDVLIRVNRRLPLVVSPASFTKQIADRHHRPLHSRSRLPLVVSHPAKGRQTSCHPLLAFLGARASRSRFQTLTSSFSSSRSQTRLSDRSTPAFPALARLKADWLLPSVSLPSLGHSPSQSAERGLVWRREGRRRTSRYTTTVHASYTSQHTCNVHLPNNLAKHAFNGGSGLILFLITH